MNNADFEICSEEGHVPKSLFGRWALLPAGDSFFQHRQQNENVIVRADGCFQFWTAKQNTVMIDATKQFSSHWGQKQ